MSLETIVNDLVTATDALHASITDKRTVLDAAAQAAAASLTTTQGLQAQAATSAATAAAKATEATNNANQVAAYKTAAAALDVTTTATAAVTNLLPDMLAKKDPARHPFRKKMPTLVLDFERQKCHRYAPGSGFGETALSSFMTFARNSTATYTGPDGLIKTAAANEARFDYDPLTGECKGLLVEEQRTNLLTYSSNFNAWTLASARLLPNAAIAPNGTLTAYKLIPDATKGYHIVRRTYVIEASGKTFTVFAKKAEYDGLLISASNTMFPFNELVVSLVDGSVTSKGGAITTAAVTSVGNGWFKVAISYTTLADSAYNIGVCNAGTRTFAGDNSSGIYIWGAQLEAGAFPTSYIPTPAVFSARASTATYLDANGVVQTAASGVARSNAYDYDSDGVLRPIGLLLEASATNQLLYSEQFDNAAWVKNGGGVASVPVVTSNYGVAPDGQTTADRVVLALNAGATLSDTCDITQNQTTIAGSTYTQSIWLKTADASSKVVQLSFAGENPKLVTVTGTWQRFSNTGVASDTARGFRLALRGTTGTSDSADLLVWGAQQGVGSYPTSYIPTTSAQVTRAADTSTSAQATRVADDAKVDGTKFSDFYNQSQGTLVAGATFNNMPTGFPRISSLSKAGSFDDSIGLLISGAAGKCAASVRTGAVTQADLSATGSFTVGQHTRSAMRIKKDDIAMSAAGVDATTDTSAVLPVCTQLQVGPSSSSGIGSGIISRISYYPQPFTNEELQAATSA